MANRWADGLGRYGGTKAYMLNGSSSQAWAQVDGSFDLSSANPRTGTHHLRLLNTNAGTTQIIRRVFGSPLTEVFLGFAVYPHSLPATEGGENGTTNGLYLCSLRDQSNEEQIRLMLGTDGSLELHRYGTIGAGVVLGRTDPCIGDGAYQHIEIYAKAGNGTAGAFELRVDEVTRLNLTGIDTVWSSNVEFSQFAIVRQQGTDHGTMDFADFFVNDTDADGSGCDTFVGDVKSGVIMVNADTAQADFTKSSGSVGYSLLDELPPNDAGYIETASTTATSDFGIANTVANVSEILTARPFDRAWKDDAGTCLIAPNLVSDGTPGTVSDQPITTAPAYYDSNVPIDPDTGVPWTKSGLDAALRRVERTA